MTKRILALIAAAGWLFFYLPAAAQQGAPCSDHALALEHLGKKYQEAAAASGVANTGNLVEILVSPDGSTWSMLITRPDGVTCLVAAGENWEAVSAPKPGEGA